MGKSLIIVESPAKVRTLSKFLGKAFIVEASVGHVRDLPSKTLGVNEANDFAPQYEIIAGKAKVVDKLKQAASKADHVFLAPDPDREGEAIAWHLAELIKDANTNISRIQFNEISDKAVREALNNPREVDNKLFWSQQARRILDRLVGYKLSPILWQKVKRGLSAGRVQSVALRLIVEREKVRQAFVPVEYWDFKAKLETLRGESFIAELFKVSGKKPAISSAEAAQGLEESIKKETFNIVKAEEKERNRAPLPPFITSTLQQAGNQRLGYSAKKTMSAAQKLYEGMDLGEKGIVGLITYMRTDSTRISADAVAEAREYIEKNLGKEYLPPKTRTFKKKASAQDAHEAIRPVDVNIKPEDIKGSLPKDQFAVYKLVWERFVASQMKDATFHDTTVTLEAGKTIWRAKGVRMLFPGFLKIQGMEDSDAAKLLPTMEAGEEVKTLEITKAQKFTQPPARFNEGSLVKELEEKGIGRPSSYAQIISTLLDREYTRLEEKALVPTDLGSTVSDLLTEHFTRIMDVDFTAQMEKALDEVAEGNQDWVNLLRTFTDDFYPTLTKASKEMTQVKSGKETGLTCEKCGQPMVIKFGRNGEFLACSGYPECRNTSNFIRNASGEIEITAAPKEELQEVGVCPQCGKALLLKRARTGSRFIACSGYPECKYAKPFGTGVACPREGCSGELVEKSSKRGKIFYSCDQYPNCDYAIWNWPVNEPCPECNSPILMRKFTKTRGEHLACPEKACKYYRSLEEEEDSQS